MQVVVFHSTQNLILKTFGIRIWCWKGVDQVLDAFKDHTLNENSFAQNASCSMPFDAEFDFEHFWDKNLMVKMSLSGARRV